MTTLTAKEQFFRTILVPIAQIAMALRHYRYIGDVFNKVCFYVINPNITADLALLGKLLTELKMKLLAYDEISVAELAAAGHWPKVQECFRQRKDVTSAIDRLTAQILDAIGYSDETHESFYRLHSQVETPITIGGRRTKWKTFVRHMGFNETMAAHNLTERIKTINQAKYTSNVGASLAPALWEEVFGIAYDVNNLVSPASVLLKLQSYFTAQEIRVLSQALNDSQVQAAA